MALGCRSQGQRQRDRPGPARQTPPPGIPRECPCRRSWGQSPKAALPHALEGLARESLSGELVKFRTRALWSQESPLLLRSAPSPGPRRGAAQPCRSLRDGDSGPLRPRVGLTRRFLPAQGAIDAADGPACSGRKQAADPPSAPRAAATALAHSSGPQVAAPGSPPGHR